MSILEELKGLNANSAVILAIFFVSFIAPAFLLIYRLNPELFLTLDTTKLIVLSISFSSQSFLALFIVTWISDTVLTHMGYHEKGHLGTYVDWFVTHGISNTSIMYTVCFIVYVFGISSASAVWCLIGLVIPYIVFEFWRVIIVAKGPNFKKSAISRD